MSLRLVFAATFILVQLMSQVSFGMIHGARLATKIASTQGSVGSHVVRGALASRVRPLAFTMMGPYSRNIADALTMRPVDPIRLVRPIGGYRKVFESVSHLPSFPRLAFSSYSTTELDRIDSGQELGKPVESILLLDEPLSSSNLYLKRHLIHAEDEYWNLSELKSEELVSSEKWLNLEHANYIGYLLSDPKRQIKIIPRLYSEISSIYQSIDDAYKKGCRLVSLSQSTALSQADLSSFSPQSLRGARDKYSEYLVSHLVDFFIQVRGDFSQVVLSQAELEEQLSFFFSILEENEAEVERLSRLSALHSDVVEFIHEVKSAAELSLIPNYKAVGIDPLSRAIEDHPDMIFVMAAGNHSENLDLGNPRDEVIQKRKFNNVITVASTDSTGTLSVFSNYGKATVHLAAQGEGVAVLSSYGELHTVSGTSYAVPRVARTIAKMRLMNPALSVNQIKEILSQTLTKNSKLNDHVMWGGVLNSDAAVNKVRESL